MPPTAASQRIAPVTHAPPRPTKRAKSAPTDDKPNHNAPGDRSLSLTVRTEGCIVPPTARLVETCLRFGVPLEVAGRTIADNLRVGLASGTITLVTGPSGSGKSLLLRAIARHIPDSRMVHAVPFPSDVSVIDAVAPTRPLYDALGILTACGLGEPMLWIQRFDQLSDGERFRARLARALSLQQRHASSAPLLCDEFGAILHRRLARSLAFNLRKLVSRRRLCLVVATSQDDLADDLRPDHTIRLGGPSPIIEPGKAQAAARAVSFAPRLRIERGTARDYERFSPMHYRRRDQLGFVDRVFVMRDGSGGDPLGIVIYGHPLLEVSLRNRITGSRFTRNAKRLNRELRVLKRLVIHPDVRGCGLGHWLVARTLPLAGTRFVECLAAMGAVNPIFDKAGMLRVGTIAVPPKRERAVNRLRAAGADPLALDFVAQVCRRPAVRRIVAASVQDWYSSTTGGSADRASRLSPMALAQTFRQLAGSQPVYFIWSGDNRGRQLIQAGLKRMEAGSEMQDGVRNT
ncbi:MAG: hypothetical protein GXY55_18330 [Phycisphaerae bacterium]|nr:hypothetical protein [Phycisphaerae bacterium]